MEAVRTILDGSGRVIRKTDYYFVALAKLIGRPMHWRPYTFVQNEFDKIWTLAGPGEMVAPGARPALPDRVVRDRFRRAIRYEVRRLGVELTHEEVDKLADRLTVVLEQVMAGTANIDDITATRIASRVMGTSSRAFSEFTIRKPAAEQKASDRKEMLRKIFEENLALQKSQS